MEGWDPELFFAEQVTTNACATQAILSILMNNENIDVGEELTNFKSFTTGAMLDPANIGYSIGSHELIKSVHNSFHKPDPIVYDKSGATEKEDAFHFISYVPFRGRLYELDGLRKGPIDHGEISDNWLAVAREKIQERMNKYAESEIRFNLLALIEDIEHRETEKLKTSRALEAHICEKLGQECNYEGEISEEVKAMCPGS